MNLSPRDGLDMTSIGRDLDAMHVMSYDFYGSWGNTAKHHAPLRGTGNDYLRFFPKTFFSVDVGVACVRLNSEK